MRIGELAEQVGVNPKTVRYYEQIGLIPPAPRTAGGYREYADTDAARLTFIKTAQRLGLSLEEVAEMLRLRERGEPPCGYVRDVLGQQLRSVDKRIAELRALRTELRELRAAADTIPEVDGATCRIIEHVKAATDPATARARTGGVR
jgi:DNA-binding transcriptional MerR regulator